MDFISLDVETANADLASICSIGLAGFDAGQCTKRLQFKVNPEDDFDPMNVAIHGIRPEDVADDPNLTWPARFLGQPKTAVLTATDRTSCRPSSLAKLKLLTLCAYLTSVGSGPWRNADYTANKMVMHHFRH